MTSSHRSFLAFFALGLLACGANGSGSGPGSGTLGSSSGFGSSDPGPFSGTGTPGQQSGTTAGPSPTGSPGPYAAGGGSICAQLCPIVGKCVGGADACASQCEQEIAKLPCQAELLAFYACAAPYLKCGPDPKDKNDDSEIHFEDGAFTACGDVVLAAANCQSGNGSGGKGGSSSGEAGKGGSTPKGGSGGSLIGQGGAAASGGSGAGPQGGTSAAEGGFGGAF